MKKETPHPKMVRNLLKNSYASPRQAEELLWRDYLKKQWGKLDEKNKNVKDSSIHNASQVYRISETTRLKLLSYNFKGTEYEF